MVLWDLSDPSKPAGLRPGLAERWEQDPSDPQDLDFPSAPGVNFHDGTPVNADAIIWNYDRFFRNDSPQFEPAASGITRARTPIMASYRKIDDFTVALTTNRVASYFPYMVVYHLMASPQAWESAGRDWARVAAAAGRHRAVPPEPLRAAAIGRTFAQRQLLGHQPPRTARSHPAAADARGEYPPGRPALGPGGLDRGAAARCHPLAAPGRLQRDDRLLPACLAVVLPDERRENTPFRDVRVRQGAELLRRSRRAGAAAQRHGGAFGRLAEAQRSGLRQPAEPLSPATRRGAVRCWPKPASTRRTRCASG